MVTKKAPWVYTVGYVLCICGALNLAGCGNLSRPQLFPVAGMVYLDGEPLINKINRDGKPLALGNDTGRMDYAVIFHPDPAKGNTNPWTCEGWLSSQPRSAGRYEMWTVGYLARASRRADWTSLARNAVSPLDGTMWEGHDSGTRKGAPLGWYKVTILASELGVPEGEIAKIRKYLKKETTPLSIEVVKNPEPGHYDFKLESEKETEKRK